MTAMSTVSRLPLQSGGFIETKIDIGAVEHLADRDRTFILAVIERLTAYAGVLVSLEPDVPTVLAGRVGGRP